MSTALSIVLDLTRVVAPDDPHAFRFEPQGYTLRGPTGGLERFDIPWSADLLADLDALRQPWRDPAVVQRLGDVMQRALRPIGWTGLGEQIRGASESGRPVLITLRSNAAELYALPWELLTVGASGQHLGELAGVLLRHEWPATTTSPERPAPRPEGGRVLLAWSAAGGAVPAADHQRALATAWSEGHAGFDPAGDVLPHASPARLASLLAAAEAAGRPFTVLHLLAHGGLAGTTFGLALDGEDEPRTIIDAGRLRQLLAPHAGTLRLVVLAACDGANTGAVGNHLGSVAQALHRAGVQSVVASRYPLSVDGSVVLAEALHHALLVDLHSLERAFILTRDRLARRIGHLDWASLQLYARAADGDDTRPVVFCPYRGLLVFEARHRRFFFGRDAECRETLGDLQALIDGDKPRFLVVVGASGTGKSSMVLSGVVPDVAHLKPRRPGPWQVATMVPGHAPLAPLRAILDRRGDRPLLLIVDQFEEVFTHIADAAARQAFVRELWSLARADTGVHVIVTLRVDFLGHCGELIVDDTGVSLDRVAYDEAHRVFVARMAHDQVRAAIERPAAIVGLHFGPGLLERILADVGAEPGALPLLQYALGRLWAQRRGHTLTPEVYEEIGGLVGALEKDADDLIAHLDDEQRQHARHLLTQLVDTREDETADTRRRVAVAELEPADPHQRVIFDALLGRLVDARLVVRSGEGAAPTLEIAHEALIRRWGVLRAWIGEDRVMLLELEKLRAWARDWNEHRTLLTGTKLDRASEFVRHHPGDVDEPVRRLVHASEDEHRRLAATLDATRRRRRRAVVTVISVLVAGILGMTGVSAYALQQRSHAEAQERRANKLLETATDITEELLRDVLPAYAGIAGTADLQRDLHARLQAMLETLRTDAAEDAGLLALDFQQRMQRGELARSHERLDPARREFERALAIAEAWAAAEPTNFEAQRAVPRSLRELGDVALRTGDLAAARAASERAVKASEALPDPTSDEARYDLSLSLVRIGEVEREAGDLSAARTVFTRSFETLAALHIARPRDTDVLEAFAVVINKLGDLDEEGGDLAAARKRFEHSLDLVTQLVAADPSRESRRELSIARLRVGDAVSESGDRPAARVHFEHGLEILEALHAAEPTDTQLRRDLSVALGKLAELSKDDGDVPAARKALARALEIFASILADDPGSAEVQHQQVATLIMFGEVEALGGDATAARAAFQSALTTAEALVVTNPTNLDVRRRLAVALFKLADADADTDADAARAGFERAREILEALAEANPGSANVGHDLAGVHNKLGYLAARAGDSVAAHAAFERSLAHIQAIASASPTNVKLRHMHVAALRAFGDAELQLQNLAAARTAFAQVVELSDALLKSDPQDQQARIDLIYGLGKVGVTESNVGNLAAARAAFERARELLEALVTADQDPEVQRELSNCHLALGMIDSNAGNLSAARAAFLRALEISQALRAAAPTDADANEAVVDILDELTGLAEEEEDLPEALRHLRAAKAILDDMHARGQIAGNAEREAMRAEVLSTLADYRGL